MAKQEIKLANENDKIAVMTLLESQTEFTKVLVELKNSLDRTSENTNGMNKYFTSTDPTYGFKKDLKEFSDAIIAGQKVGFGSLFAKIAGTISLLTILISIASGIFNMNNRQAQLDDQTIKIENALTKTLKAELENNLLIHYREIDNSIRSREESKNKNDYKH